LNVTKRISKVERTSIRRKSKSVSTATISRLANMSNLNSVKSILMAMQIAAKYAETVFSKNPKNYNRLKRIRLYSLRLNRLSNSLHTEKYIDPEELYRELRLASIAYVNLFYGASQSDRNAFLSSCMSDGLGRRVNSENNLILLPSILAANEVPVGKASFSILAGLHKKSFMAIKQAMKSAASMELFRNSSAIGSNSENIERINKSIYEIDGIISNMHGLMKNYEAIEAKKLELISEMCDIGESSGFPVDSVIESISAPYNVKRPSIMRR